MKQIYQNIYSKNNLKKINGTAILVLENGKFFKGFGLGYEGSATGEVCFNTSITGYQEILTDPSYYKQIINFTFPHIGIVGSNTQDKESSKIFASACIVNNVLTPSSNFRSEVNFETWLLNNKKACITGVDTRELTKLITEDFFLLFTTIESKPVAPL